MLGWLVGFLVFLLLVFSEAYLAGAVQQQTVLMWVLRLAPSTPVHAEAGDPGGENSLQLKKCYWCDDTFNV